MYTARQERWINSYDYWRIQTFHEKPQNNEKLIVCVKQQTNKHNTHLKLYKYNKTEKYMYMCMLNLVYSIVFRFLFTWGKLVEIYTLYTLYMYMLNNYVYIEDFKDVNVWINPMTPVSAVTSRDQHWP